MKISFPEPCVLSHDEALELLNKAAHRVLGCSAQEFLDRWDNGEFESTDSAEVAELSSLIRYVR